MTTNFNLRLDDQLKEQSFDVIKSFGLSPSQFMRMVLKQVADTGSLPLSLEKREKLPTDKLLSAIAELENGETTTFDSLDDFAKAFGNEKN